MMNLKNAGLPAKKSPNSQPDFISDSTPAFSSPAA
jgi:hypothetical protein